MLRVGSYAVTALKQCINSFWILALLLKTEIYLKAMVRNNRICIT